MSLQKHHVVAVDNWVKPPALEFDHEFTQYDNTSPEQLPERLKDATIVICSSTPITRAGLENAPKLQLVSCNGVGTDHVDKETIRERGISLCYVPAQNTASVSEHAFALYYALRRNILPLHKLAMDGGSWKANLGNLIQPTYNNKPPRINAEETLIIIGYGAIGNYIEKVGKALEMKVLIAERKGAQSVREGRTAFDKAIKQGTVFMVVTPLDADTRDMIGSAEFESMDESAFVINVGRGGVVNEPALAQALKDGQIAGAGMDVFEHEPATKDNCPLLDPAIPNLVLTPHSAWYSLRTLKGTTETVKANIEKFAAGNPQNLLISAGRDCKL